MSKRRPTLKEIAEIARVTPTTVSLALRGHPRISAATRDKVRKVAEELGYRQDAHLSRLMRHLREPAHRKEYPVIALISDYDWRLDSETHSTATWAGFSRRAIELGYTPQELSIHLEGLSAKRLQGILEARGIGGIIFASLRKPDFLKELDLSRFACAGIESALGEPRLHRAASDRFFNTVLLCEHLWQEGFRRIGLVIPEIQEMRVDNTFLGGYLSFQFRHSHAGFPTPLVYEDLWDGAAILKWAGQARPDAIIAAYPGLGQYLAEHWQGDDRPFVCVVNHQEDTESPGISQRHDLIAATAVNLADAQLGRNDLGLSENPTLQLVRGTLVGMQLVQ
jgi:LacI family transcriptional regulator